MATKAQFQLQVIAWVFAVIVFVALSMFVTWVAVSRYPVPDDDSINLGLFLFFLVVFLDVFLMGDLTLGEHLRGRKKAIPVFKLAGIFMQGLLVAAVVGMLPWSIGWFLSKAPWIPQGVRIAVLILTVLALWRGRRKPPASRPEAPGDAV